MSDVERGDIRYDGHGKIVAMAVADGWILCRRPGCAPFAIYEKDWLKLAENQQKSEPTQGDQQ